MRRAVFSALLLAAHASAGSFWCAAPKNSPAGGEFRGNYQDFDLYVDNMSPACVFVLQHVSGNDGLWVLEFKEASKLLEDYARLQALHVPVHLRLNNSMVVAAGEDLTTQMGYDACGSDPKIRAISVPKKALKPQQGLTEREQARRAAMRVDPRIQQALEMIQIGTVPGFVSHLQNFNSRNSYLGSQLPDAALWVSEQYASFGFNVSRHRFRTDMAAQVIAEKVGLGPNPGIVVVGAHLDSRTRNLNSPTDRAPGADDNGSGSAAMVTLAKILHDSNIPLRHTIRICSFTGEEQGLLGSRALATEWAAAGVQIIGMLNGDMIGYRKPNTPTPILGYVNRFVNQEMTAWSAELTRTYVPQLTLAFTATCCSDHQSFFENGYRSISFFENDGVYADYPQYHTSDDLLMYLDSENLMYHTRALLASLLEIAEPLDN